MYFEPTALSNGEHHLDHDPQIRDRSGLGLLVGRVTYDLQEDKQRIAAFLDDIADHLHRKMGTTRIWRGSRFTGVYSSYDIGDRCNGTDPDMSVADAYLMAYGPTTSSSSRHGQSYSPQH